MEFIVVFLFAIFCSGNCLNCFTCNGCNGDVFRTECQSTQDVCISFKENYNITNLRCGQSEECRKVKTEVVGKIFNFINKDIEFEDIFKQDLGTSVRCCKSDYCNKLVENTNSVTDELSESYVNVSKSSNLKNAEVKEERSSEASKKLDKNNNSSYYIAPKLLEIAMLKSPVKRNAQFSESNRDGNSIRSNSSEDSYSILDDHLKYGVQKNITMISDSVTEIGSEKTVLTTDSSNFNVTSSAVSTSVYLFGIELLIFMSICNFNTFKCFI